MDNSWLNPYGVCLVVGLLVWWWTSRRQAKQAGIDPSHVDLLAPLIVVMGILGARGLSLISPGDLQVSGHDTIATSRFRLFGWIGFGLITLLAYCRRQRISFLTAADCFASPSVLAVAIGRSGCLLAGCCWGDVCMAPSRLESVADAALVRQIQTLPALCGERIPWAIRYPAGSFAHRQQVTAGLLEPDAQSSLPVHPVQLYESGLLFCLAGWIGVRSRKRSRAGQGFLLALAGYSLIRFVTEYFRADSPIILGALTLTQLICLGIVTAAGVVAVGILRPRKPTSTSPT